MGEHGVGEATAFLVPGDTIIAPTLLSLHGVCVPKSPWEVRKEEATGWRWLE